MSMNLDDTKSVVINELYDLIRSKFTIRAHAVFEDFFMLQSNIDVVIIVKLIIDAQNRLSIFRSHNRVFDCKSYVVDIKDLVDPDFKVDELVSIVESTLRSWSWE